ncbi:MAG TPA: hypothetical protein VI589_12320 [Vicinamibacteria bacterium]
MRAGARVRALGLAFALAFLPSAGARDQPASTPEWRSFAGTWSASGRRHLVAVEGGGQAAIVEVEGAVVLADPGGLSRGFHGQVIGFDDGQGASIGRCVWTDESGGRLFSRLRGEPLETGKRFSGTITGGTGRYAALEGEYSFTWQYVVATEDGRLQGRAVGLSGRVRRGESPR